MNSCAFALVSDAWATIATMRATTDSSGALVTRTSSAPVPFMVPAYTAQPGCLATGIDSPVTEDWSISDAPSTTTPSPATRSPGRTRMRSPTVNWAASITVSAASPATRVARSGARSRRAVTESRVRLVATASSAPDVAKMTISRAPSSTCPMVAATIAATTMSRSTSSVLARSACRPARPGSHHRRRSRPDTPPTT